MIKKRTTFLAAVMLIMAILSACGQDGAGSAGTGENVGTDNMETGEKDKADSAYISGIRVEDYVTLGEYKGIELTEDEPAVSEEDVDQYIDAYILPTFATTTVVEDRTDVREGDTVNIDYAGYRDGVAFDGGTAQGHDLTIGSGTFIPGFEDGLIGSNVGDTVTLDLTFPDDYRNTEMAGASVSFEVTINSISIMEVPELTDEIVKELGVEDCSTPEEFRAYLYDYFSSSALNNYNQTIKYHIIDAVLADCVFEAELPEKLIDRYYNILVEDMTMAALTYGMDFDTYAQNYYGMDEEGYTEELRSNARSMAKQYIMFQAIADAEGLNMTDEERNTAMEEWAQNNGYESVDTLLEQIDEETCNEYLMAEKVVAYLIDNAIISPSSAD